MAVRGRFFIRCILTLSLVNSSLPALPIDTAAGPSQRRSCFELQALAAPALSDMHDAARRGSAVCVNTVQLFRRLFYRAVRVFTSIGSPAHGDDILGLFAQAGNADARDLFKRYWKNRVAFFTLLGVRTFVSMLFIGFIAFWEAHNHAYQFLYVYLGLMGMDSVFQIFVLGNRAIFNDLLYKEFPRLFKAEVARMRPSREPDENLAHMFSEPYGTARLCAGGILLSIYVWENWLGIAAIVGGLLYMNVGIALTYAAVALLAKGLVNRLSSKTSSTHMLARDEQLKMDHWSLKTEWLIDLGFPSEVAQAGYGKVSTAIARASGAKLKLSTMLRVLMALIPGLGAYAAIPFATLAASRGLEIFNYFPDWLKEKADAEPAEKSIRHFLRHHLWQPQPDLSPFGFTIDRLRLRDFSLSVPGQELMRGVNMDIKVGVNLLYGSNGLGKTTLLRTLAGMDRTTQSSGRADVVGTVAREEFTLNTRDVGERIQYCRPSALSLRMTPRTLMEELNEDQQYQFRYLITAVDSIPVDFNHTTLNKLSTGQQARIQLAFVIAKTKADILFLDEAFANMDPESRERWITILIQYAKDHHNIIVMAEKEVVQPFKAFDRVFELKDGTIQRVRNGRLPRIAA